MHISEQFGLIWAIYRDLDNQLFFMFFQCYVHANFVQIYQQAYEISCRQSFFWLNFDLNSSAGPKGLGKDHQSYSTLHPVTMLYP